MSNRRPLACLIGSAVLVLGLVACAPQPSPTIAPTATPKPPAATADQAKPAPAAPAPAKPAAAVLSPQFADLQRGVAVQSAQAYIDGAGFHGMTEELEKTKEIKPGYISKVRNVMAVANAASWPSELAKEQQKLIAELKALEAALVGNKAQDAEKAAKAVHEAQHDLSKASFGWLGGQSKLSQIALFKTQDHPDHLLGCVGVQSAQAYIDGAGFHGMTEDLEKTKEIKSSYISKVRNVMAVANMVPWPAELAKEQQKLIAELKALEAALVGNKPQDAEKAAKAVHEAEHDLSKATFGWLGGQKHNHSAMMEMVASNKAVQSVMMTGVQSAQAYIDGAGFHDMGEELEKTKEIKSGYISKVRNVMAIANTVPWPTELAKEQQKLMADLKALETALVGNKAQEAQKAAEAVHEAEHDLSKATFAWLGTQKVM